MQKLRKEQEWFQEAKIGMFIHLGLYAILARKSEWVMRHELIPRNEYEKLMNKFKLERFDAELWVNAAKSMGANYITVTTKHHEGFCLWDTEFTEYKITNTPFGSDLIKELVNECHKQNMRIIFYYSLLDWHHPAYVNTEPPDWPEARPGDKPDWPIYQKYIEDQVRELCTKYGRIDGVWWDVGGTKSAEEWNAEKLYEMIRELQPHAVVNNRAQIPADFDVGERLISKEANKRLVENCESIGAKAWCFVSDEAYYSPETLLKGLTYSLASGCNYLLNIGPCADGSIAPCFVDRLKIIGNWLEANRNAIWDSQKLDISCHYFRRRENVPLGICTCRDNTIYQFINERPIIDSFIIFGPKTLPAMVELMDGTPLEVQKVDYGIEIKNFPLNYNGIFPAVVKLTFDCKAEIDVNLASKFTPSVIKLSSDGENILYPGTARMLGANGSTPPLLKTIPEELNSTGWWSKKDQYISWDIECLEAREFELLVEYEVGKRMADAEYTVTVAANCLYGRMEHQGENPFFIKSLGRVRIPTGTFELTVRPQKMSPTNLFGDIRKVILK